MYIKIKSLKFIRAPVTDKINKFRCRYKTRIEKLAAKIVSRELTSRAKRQRGQNEDEQSIISLKA
jgi:hypothetical protein